MLPPFSGLALIALFPVSAPPREVPSHLSSNFTVERTWNDTSFKRMHTALTQFAVNESSGEAVGAVRHSGNLSAHTKH